MMQGAFKSTSDLRLTSACLYDTILSLDLSIMNAERFGAEVDKSVMRPRRW